MFLSIILKFCMVYFISPLFCAEKKNTLSFWDKKKGEGCYFNKTLLHNSLILNKGIVSKHQLWGKVSTVDANFMRLRTKGRFREKNQNTMWFFGSGQQFTLRNNAQSPKKFLKPPMTHFLRNSVGLKSSVTQIICSIRVEVTRFMKIIKLYFPLIFSGTLDSPQLGNF